MADKTAYRFQLWRLAPGDDTVNVVADVVLEDTGLLSAVMYAEAMKLREDSREGITKLLERGRARREEESQAQTIAEAIKRGEVETSGLYGITGDGEIVRIADLDATPDQVAAELERIEAEVKAEREAARKAEADTKLEEDAGSDLGDVLQKRINEQEAWDPDAEPNDSLKQPFVATEASPA